jgi:hypothetical protein
MKRYKVYRGAMHEDENGKYVLHSDVEQFRTEVRELVDAVFNIGVMYDFSKKYSNTANPIVEAVNKISVHLEEEKKGE